MSHILPCHRAPLLVLKTYFLTLEALDISSSIAKEARRPLTSVAAASKAIGAMRRHTYLHGTLTSC